MSMTRRKWIGGGVLVIAAVVAVGVILTLRGNERPVTTEEARQRTSTTATTADPEDARPAAGVYEYEGSGTQSLSVPPLSQTQGPTMPATVEHLDDGCWHFRIDYSTNQWQQWTYCTVGGDLVETGGTSWQRWMIGATALTNLSRFDCGATSMALPEDPSEDQEWEARCVGTNDAVDGEVISQGPYRSLGEEKLEIGDETVVTHHFVGERTMTGSQVGTERTEVWFDVETGLPVRNERTIEARTDTPIGESTYTETGEFRLVSPDPVG